MAISHQPGDGFIIYKQLVSDLLKSLGALAGSCFHELEFRTQDLVWDAAALRILGREALRA